MEAKEMRQGFYIFHLFALTFIKAHHPPGVRSPPFVRSPPSATFYSISILYSFSIYHGFSTVFEHRVLVYFCLTWDLPGLRRRLDLIFCLTWTPPLTRSPPSSRSLPPARFPPPAWTLRPSVQFLSSSFLPADLSFGLIIQ